MGGIDYADADIETSSEQQTAFPPTCVGVWKHMFFTQLWGSVAELIAGTISKT